jgi:two-component system NtrC family response regulator
MAVKIGKRILIVEDHLESEELLRMILEDEGYLVESVRTGQAAIQKIDSASKNDSSAYPLDLILLDLRLPDMNGVKVVRQLQESRVEVPPVIFLSADPLQSLTEAATSVGAGAVRKPFEFDELFQAIRSALATVADA